MSKLFPAEGALAPPFTDPCCPATACLYGSSLKARMTVTPISEPLDVSLTSPSWCSAVHNDVMEQRPCWLSDLSRRRGKHTYGQVIFEISEYFRNIQ